MPSLTDLKLNRHLFRDNGTVGRNSSQGSVYQNPGVVTNSSQASGGGDGSDGSNGGQLPAQNVAPGTVIQSATWQSSPGDDRIEINPDDQFIAYRDGVPYVVITREGINTSYIFGDDADFNTVDVNEVLDVVVDPTNDFGLFMNGFPQPLIYRGIAFESSSPGLASLPPGWSLTKNGVGDYTINFDPAVTVSPYQVICTPISGHFRYQIPLAGLTATSFDVTWQESLYGSDVFPVSGGGGGNVTVSGVYQGETPVDVDFQITVLSLFPQTL